MVVPRFGTAEAVESYVARVRALAETPSEVVIARLVRQWARWHYRWSTKPTAANDRREHAAWCRVRGALAAADMEDTWLDPR